MNTNKPEINAASHQSHGPEGTISRAEMARYIDHTLLKPESTREQYDQIVNECIQYNFKSICVNSYWVSYVAQKLQGSGIEVCSVVGFPLGAMTSESKAFEAGDAVSAGARKSIWSSMSAPSVRVITRP